ncbi:FHA domain-containing protein [Microbacterium sp.]|uniref:FHA domain-containing protein n=1 Tax=Microbacterium sp. TaxID=51671 RepID=UPI002810C5C0|nr:FHA domain-containing protein [Microbacterium sp.]
MTLSPPAAPPAATMLRSGHPGTARVNASAGKRAGAYLIDFAIVAAIGVTVWLLTGSLLLTAVAVVELWAIGWVWEGHTGATPGNLICGIRTVRRDSLLSVGAGGLLLRSLLMGLSHAIPILLPVSLAASGALDGVARARVIDVGKVRGSTTAEIGGTAQLEARVTRLDDPSAAPEPLPSRQSLITRAPVGPRTVAMPVPERAAPAAPATAATPEPAPAVASGPGTVPVFELGDGTVIRATGLGFIGRAPRAPESIPDAILVRVPDGARSLSRTHASFGVEDGQLWVQDLGSANGASVRHLGGTVTELTPHSPRFLVPGDVLILGGDAELAFRRVVERADAAAAAPQPAAPAAPMEAAAPAPQAPVELPAAAPAGPVIALQFQDGTTVPVRGTGYIGRAPSLPDGERADAALIAVPDGDRSVSRTHGRFGIVGGQTWFEDLGSGNGSSLRTGDGRSGPMTPHQRFTLVPGMVLQLGDCVVRVIAV